jgi:hypothetical protein
MALCSAKFSSMSGPLQLVGRLWGDGHPFKGRARAGYDAIDGGGDGHPMFTIPVAST